MSSAHLAVSARRKAPQESNRWKNAIIRRGATVLLGAAAGVLAAGCGAARPPKYYQLALPNDLSSMKANDPIPVTLLIGRLKASHLYREDRIVYSGKGEEMGTYEYQRWTEPPTEMIEEMLLRDLRATARYQGVYSQGSETRGDFLLQGRLFDFKEISDGAFLARVTLDLELRDMKTGTAVWAHSYTHDEPVNTKDISAVVAALNRNAQRGVREVCASLDQYFVLHP
jgi:ABC-type uncharacterized transport system auxiliary subunit